MKKISLSILLCSILLAQDTDVTLDEVTVSANQEHEAVKEKKVGVTKIKAETLNKQQVADSRDLVRYETGVSVVEAGRHGASGYAIRGVDENRVGIVIDGLRQAETLSSQGFRDIFEGYGNYNNTRNGVEIENVKMATITKGADSIKSGSGALGGSVMFETKDARDYLIDKDYYFGFKHGYQSVDSQNFTALTTAARFKWFDIMVINTNRKGHERKNYFYDIYANDDEDRSAVGKTREKADPYEITRKSTLVKLGLSPFEELRFSVAIDDSKIRSRGEDLSYLMRFGSIQYSVSEVEGERKNDDSSHRKNVSYTIESFTPTPFWDSVKISYSNQKIKNKARTDDYCSGPKCKHIQNPQGLKLVTNNGVAKIVDKDGKELEAEKKTQGYVNVAEYKLNGKKLENKVDYQEWNVESTFINCDYFGGTCPSKFKVFQKKDENGNEKFQFIEKEITIKNINGKKYGTFELKQTDKGYYTQKEELFFVVPGTAGYETNYFNDRDLNTDTKQFNIDFEKEFELLNTEHSLRYGAMYSTSTKSMVNADGYAGGNIQWWQEAFFGYKQITNQTTYQFEYLPRPNNWANSESIRHNVESRDTYLIPVKSINKSLYVGDYINGRGLFDWIGFDLNYRFDKVTHSPNYDDESSSSKLPRGLLVGVLEPMPCAMNLTDDCRYNSPKVTENLRKNLALLLRKREFRNDSYSLGVDLDPLSWFRVQVKYSNGFRAPTSDEMYMTFKHPSFSITPNTNLKAETAKTKELALTLHKNSSFATFNWFKTDYENFIDMVYKGERPVVLGSALKYPFWQNINRDEAVVRGFEVSSRVELGDIHKSLDGFRVGYRYTHQKGRMNKTIPMNALQPNTQVYTIGYSTPGDKYGIDVFVTSVAAKKADDTYNMYWEDQKNQKIKVNGKEVTDSTMAWRSGSYSVIDAIAYARPAKNFSFGFGVYNITDRKYITWDSARSIRAFGASNLIDQNTGRGIKRFYAPGRNFKFTWEVKF
ncbi:TonB-dependent hemoglobin/transferrin/lactoferrin family receptor [Campylobacter majalis]|uniref:TonB-dependent hemoglobin/transferrin/lactoferrin family receptor n=1 Tax=Campylobacter majalis TaxID=2790656 RepID=UPI003D6857D9